MRLDAHALIKARPRSAVGTQMFLLPSNDGDSNSSGIHSIQANLQGKKDLIAVISIGRMQQWVDG
jgi:hypothetical protein